MSFAVMDYIIIVLGKNLQMMVAYSIYNSDFDRVTKLFEQFNEQFSNYMSVFQRVTSQEFIAGRGLEGISDEAQLEEPRAELHDFLSKTGLLHLKSMFEEEGILLNDILKMDNDEMKEIGLANYKDRKALKDAIKERTGIS